MWTRRAVRRWTVGQDQARTWYAMQNFFLGLLILALAPYVVFVLWGWR